MKKVFIISAIIAVFMNNYCSLESFAIEQRYINQRNNIIKSNEYKVSVKLTDDEKIVDNKISNMKKELKQTYNSHFPYNFPILYDKKLTNSSLYHLCEKLPKGADLHVHGSAFMPSVGYIDFLSKNKQIYIHNKKDNKYGTIIYIEPNKNVPDGYINLITALNKKIFTKEQLLDLLTLSPNGYGTQADNWKHFEDLFVKADIVDTMDSDSIRKFYYDAFKKYCDSNILHIEFHRAINTDIKTERKILLIIKQAYYDIKKEYPDFNVKIIASGLKSYSFDYYDNIKRLEIAKKLQSEIKDDFYKNNVENFIIGYDLVNEEDSSRTILEYSQFLKKYRAKNFNLYLHAGESLLTNNHNLIDAYLLKPKRVGHGYNLYMFPELLEKYKRANIALEICPISNIRLGYVSDLRQHPVIEYMKRGIPIVIASDDPIFFENKSLTDDWFAIIFSFDLSLAEIKQLSQNSILYSGVSKKEKSKLMAAWQCQWQNFINEYKN